MKTLTTINGREIKGYRFSSLQRARRWIYGSLRPWRVVLGDIDDQGQGWFWVVTPADAERLQRAGYEYGF